MTRELRARLSLAALLIASLASLSCSQATEEYTGLPWIEDDYAAAVTLAQEKNLPIFVESWAPW